jgi:hypothetical protein
MSSIEDSFWGLDDAKEDDEEKEGGGLNRSALMRSPIKTEEALLRELRNAIRVTLVLMGINTPYERFDERDNHRRDCWSRLEKCLDPKRFLAIRERVYDEGILFPEEYDDYLIVDITLEEIQNWERRYFEQKRDDPDTDWKYEYSKEAEAERKRAIRQFYGK